MSIDICAKGVKGQTGCKDTEQDTTFGKARNDADQIESVEACRECLALQGRVKNEIVFPIRPQMVSQGSAVRCRETRG